MKMRYPLRSSRFRALARKYPKPSLMADLTYKKMLLNKQPDGVFDREWLRTMRLIKRREVVRDSLLAVVDIDGLLQFTQLDFIPFFYCPTKRVEELLRWWDGEGFSEEKLWSSLK